MCNENLNPHSAQVDGDLKLKSVKYTGGQIKPEVSEFKKVLKRRKSRQSTQMPCSVDFEYKGNSATLEHYLRGKHNKTQLDFEFNLRGYLGHGNEVQQERPWACPAKKCFTPKEVLRECVETAAGTHYSKLNKFVDQFDEFNQNSIAHTLEKSTSVFRNAEWYTTLRGDR